MAIGLLGMLTVGPSAAEFSPGYADFRVQCNHQELTYKTHSLFILPGEILRLEVMEKADRNGYTLAAAGFGQAELSLGVWQLRAPDVPGLYPATLFRQATGRAIHLQIFVLVPYNQLRDRQVEGYPIGAYPKPLGRLAGYGRPTGFIRVTAAMVNEAVSPHFQLAQFLCKQTGSFPNYIVLRPELLSKLEKILEELNTRGVPLQTLHMLCGYRTPYYNRLIHDARYSAHQWGLAADIRLDEPADDFNHDGLVDMRDAELLYLTVETWEVSHPNSGLVGGMGLYPRTSQHGPFVHIDARGFRARWGLVPATRPQLALKPARSGKLRFAAMTGFSPMISGGDSKLANNRRDNR